MSTCAGVMGRTLDYINLNVMWVCSSLFVPCDGVCWPSQPASKKHNQEKKPTYLVSGIGHYLMSPQTLGQWSCKTWSERIRTVNSEQLISSLD